MLAAHYRWMAGKIFSIIVGLIGIISLFTDAMYAASVNGLGFYSVGNILIGGVITIGIVVTVVIWFILTD